MRIGSDTKDALLFITGLLGIVGQTVFAAFGIGVSEPLIAAFLVMMGIAVGPSFIARKGGEYDDESANGKPDDRRPPKVKKKARPRAGGSKTGKPDG